MSQLEVRAARIHQFGLPAAIRNETIAIAEPGPGEVRIRVEAGTVSSTDVLIRKGLYPLLRHGPPITLGYDLVGRVEAVGPGESVPVGQRVGALVQTGGQAEAALVKASDLVLLPNDLPSDHLACLVLNYMTAFGLLNTANQLNPGDSILMMGASGAVGTAICQLGRVLGLRVVGVASAAKLAHVVAQGALAEAYDQPDLHNRLYCITPQGYAAAFDPIGGTSFRRSFSLLHQNGVLLTYGTHELSQTMPYRTWWRFLRFGLGFGTMMIGNAFRTWTGRGRSAKFFGIVDYQREDPIRFQQQLDQLCHWLRTGALQPVIHAQVTLEEIATAHELLALGAVKGQLVWSAKHNDLHNKTS